MKVKEINESDVEGFMINHEYVSLDEVLEHLDDLHEETCNDENQSYDELFEDEQRIFKQTIEIFFDEEKIDINVVVAEICKTKNIEIIDAVFFLVGDWNATRDICEKGDYMTIDDVRSDYDLGYEAVEQDLFAAEDIPEHVKNYLDYERIGRGMQAEGWVLFDNFAINIY
ncbi:MAG: hypothetical protein ACTSUM_04100 [Alphaproteobacteria bacterium]